MHTRFILTRLLPVGVSIAALSAIGWNIGARPAPTTLNWAQWRGPLGSGVAPDADPPTTWSATSNIKWKVNIPGSGLSTPIIWDNFVFVQTAIPVPKTASSWQTRLVGGTPQRGRGGGMRGVQPTQPFQFSLICLDRRTGKTVWNRVAKTETPHEGHHPDHGYASHSPVTDGKYVIAYFGSRGLYCYDLKGNLKWSKDLGKMQTRNEFGEGSSPALYGNTVVVTWDHEGEDFIAAFHRETGKELWRQTRDEPTSWSTPIIVEHNGQAQVIASATRRIRSYDLKSGKLIWECGGMTTNTIPTPIASKGVLYATSGFRGNALLAIQLGKQGDLTGTNAILWSHNRNTPYVPSPLLYEDRLYLFAGNNGILSCFDAKNGQPIIHAERIEGLRGVYASPVGAGGKVYLVGRNGTTVVLKRSDKLEILATNVLDEKMDASPAIVGKEIFLRGHTHLYCIAAK
jgi:outer membrane protein assembly factor BamB